MIFTPQYHLRAQKNLRFPDGEVGHIICAEREHTDNFTNFDGVSYSIHLLCAGRGHLIKANGTSRTLEKGDIFQRPSNQPHSTIVDQEHGPWLERYIYMNGRVAKRLTALGYLPIPQLSRENAGLFTEYFIRLSDAIHRFDKAERANQEILLLLTNCCQALAQHAQPNANSSLIEQACSYLDTDITSNISLEQLAVKLGVSYNILRKRFKETKGCSLRDYRITRRINLAKQFLACGMSVTEVAEKLAYCSPFAFSKQFKQYTGVSPSSFT